MPMPSNIITLSEHNWYQEVGNEKDVDVLVDFFAPWCGACNRFETTLLHLSMKLQGEAKVCKIDVNQNRRFVHTFNIRALPTFLIFRGGAELHRVVGGRDEQYFLDLIRHGILIADGDCELIDPKSYKE